MFGVGQLCQERPGRPALPEDHHEGGSALALLPADLSTNPRHSFGLENHRSPIFPMRRQTAVAVPGAVWREVLRRHHHSASNRRV